MYIEHQHVAGLLYFLVCGCMAIGVTVAIYNWKKSIMIFVMAIVCGAALAAYIRNNFDKKEGNYVVNYFLSAPNIGE